MNAHWCAIPSAVAWSFGWADCTWLFALFGPEIWIPRSRLRVPRSFGSKRRVGGILALARAGRFYVETGDRIEGQGDPDHGQCYGVPLGEHLAEQEYGDQELQVSMAAQISPLWAK